MASFILKGNICYSSGKSKVEIIEKGCVVCKDDISLGVFPAVPEQYAEYPCIDCGDQLIIPGMTDLHVHAPQYAFRGMAMDLELIDWLNTYTFVEEAKYKDLEYAEKGYGIFVDDLVKTTTTRACVFGTLHSEATKILMDKLEEAGMVAYVGKVNMDRNSPPSLCEENAEKSAEDTEKWILASGGYKNVKPILTPRFIPTCTDDLMDRLSVLQKKYQLPMQSHLSENKGEIAWVAELRPDAAFYGDAYNKHDLFGNECPTIMAHCVHSSDAEVQMMKDQKVFVAHCPESNANLSSGIAPARKYLDEGLKMGLGSDIAAGSDLSLFRAMAVAIQCSKLRWRLVDQSLAPLKWEEAFYLATLGGGEFFGKVGSFEPGYEFDAVVLDDSSLRHPQELTVRERLERMIYLSGKEQITAKYIRGKKVL